MSQRCRRVVAAPALVLVEAARPAPGANGFVARRPLHEALEAVNEAEPVPKLQSVSGMDIRLAADPALTLDAERELRELFGVPLSVRMMPGSKKECYKELDFDFEEE